MADALSIDHYIGECFVKCAQVILGSRIFQAEQGRAPSDKRSGRWFKLEVEELASLSARLDPWRRDVYTPLIIEIYIQPWDTSAVMPIAAGSRTHASTASGAAAIEIAQGTLLERWTLRYDPVPRRCSTTCSRAAMDSATVYKYLILLIRSLYSYVRVLPAYRMYRACKRHGADLFNTQYTLSTAPLQLQQQGPHSSIAAAAAVGPHGGGSGASKMHQFHFSPVETVNGQFEIAVEYQPATTVHFLEQTTVLPCAPRIISDYVDGPYYSKSAPNSANRLLSRVQSSNAAVDDTSKGGDTGAPHVLRSPQQQQHTPIVRQSWSSKDVAAPVVQRGFNPVARSSSLNASNSVNLMGGMGSSTLAMQQQQLSLHCRPFSQGCSTAASPRGSGAAAAAGSSAAAASSLVVGSNSPVVFYGPSSLGRPPLPHSPAAAAQHGTGGYTHGPGGYTSMLPSSSSGGGGVGLGGTGISCSGGLPPASPGTPSSASRTGTSPLLLRSASVGAAAVSSAAAAAAAVAGAAAGAAAAALTSTSFGSAAAGHLSRLGSSFGSSPLGGPRVLGFGLGQQQRARSQQDIPQATQQGFFVKESTVTVSRGMGRSAQQQQQGEEEFTPASDDDLLAAAAAAAEQERQQAAAAAAAAYPKQEYTSASAALLGGSDASSPGAVVADRHQQQRITVDVGRVHAARANAGSIAAAADLNLRTVSAPVTIPGRGRGKARSVTDLPLMAAEMQQQQKHGQYTAAIGAAGAGLNPRLATSPWLSQASQGEQTGSTAVAGSGSGTAPDDAGSGRGCGFTCGVDQQVPGCRVQGGLCSAGLSRASSSLLGVQQEQQRQQKQQFVHVPSSAPAAPKGMLGQLLSGQASPSFSPPGGMGAAATARAAYGAGNRRLADDAAAEASSADEQLIAKAGTEAAGTVGIREARFGDISAKQSNAIVISQGPTAAAAGASPNSGSSAGALHSRAPNRQCCPAGAHTADVSAAAAVTTPTSILGSSPQLPFAFTPSAASLGMSLMSLADQHRSLLGTSGPGHAAGVPARGAVVAAGSAVAGNSAGSGGASTSASLGRGGGSSVPRSPLGSSSVAAVSRQDSGLGAPVGSGVGTPSPPPHVSCVRDITGLATIRRPSWSSRSSSFDVAASASLPHHLSMSPMLGDLLDPVLLGCSSSHGSHGAGTPQRLAAAGKAASGRSNGTDRGGVAMTPAVVVPGGFGSSQQEDIVQQTGSSSAGQEAATPGDHATDSQGSGSGQCEPGGAHEQSRAPAGRAAAAPSTTGADGDGAASTGCGLHSDVQQLLSTVPDESESDLLPFAIDTDAWATSHAATGQLAAAAGSSGFGGCHQQQQQGYRSGGVGVASASGVARADAPAAAAAERDVAVGAFVKLIQDAAAAPPFRRSKNQDRQQQWRQGQGERTEEHQQPLLVGDAVQQVQQLAAQLQALVFSSSSAGL